MFWIHLVPNAGKRRKGWLSQEFKCFVAHAEDIGTLGQCAHVDGLTIIVRQTEAAASIEVVNRGVSLSIAQAAHEDLPFSVGDTDRRLLLGGCGNVIDEAIKLEAATLSNS